MKKSIYLSGILFLLLVLMSSCSSDEIDFSNGWLNESDIEKAHNPNSITGVWELKTCCYPEGNYEISSDDRDFFMFNSEGKVKVVIKKGKAKYPDLPNEDGEYDYTYDMEKQVIQLLASTRKCIISNGEMRIDGYHYGPDDGIYSHEYIFIKKHI